MDRYTRSVSRQQLSKCVPVAKQQILDNATVGLQWKSCFLCGPSHDIISKGQGQLRVSSVQESVKRGLELEAEE
jgi:hypothetical protein